VEGVALYSYRRLSAANKEDGRGVRAGNEIAKHFAGNNVDVIIYAVEKSLDSYKFNLLHCKQTFISQLKSGALGARTIDEGANGREVGHELLGVHGVALRQHRPARQGEIGEENRIARRGTQVVGQGQARFGVQIGSQDGGTSQQHGGHQCHDGGLEPFPFRRQTDKEGNRLNAVKEDGVSSSDEKVIGKRLQEIAKNATTGGLYKPVGELYGFPIKVVSERTAQRGAGVYRQPLRGGGELQVHLQQRASGDG